MFKIQAFIKSIVGIVYLKTLPHALDDTSVIKAKPLELYLSCPLVLKFSMVQLKPLQWLHFFASLINYKSSPLQWLWGITDTQLTLYLHEANPLLRFIVCSLSLDILLLIITPNTAVYQMKFAPLGTPLYSTQMPLNLITTTTHTQGNL